MNRTVFKQLGHRVFAMFLATLLLLQMVPVVHVSASDFTQETAVADTDVYSSTDMQEDNASQELSSQTNEETAQEIAEEAENTEADAQFAMQKAEVFPTETVLSNDTFSDSGTAEYDCTQDYCDTDDLTACVDANTDTAEAVPAESELAIQPDLRQSDIPFVAKIGEIELPIIDGGKEYCGKMYADVQVYTVLIPENETATTFTLFANGCSYVKDGGCNGRTWDITEPIELDILEGNTYHLRKGWEKTFHIGFCRENEVLPTTKVPEITAKIGDRTLDVNEITTGVYPCNITHSYEIQVPDTLKDQTVAIAGLQDYSYRPVTNEQECDGKLEHWDGTAAVNEFGYHFSTDREYAEEYQNLHVSFKLFHEKQPEAPFQVTLDGQELQVDLLPPDYEYGPKGLRIHVPTPFAKSVTFHDVKGWMYMDKNEEYGEMFTIETNDWNAEVLGTNEFVMLSNWPERYCVTFQVDDAAKANIHLNAQMDGKFLLPPETTTEVTPGLAKEFGYTYAGDIGDKDITALDALVKMHQMKYPDEDVTQYLTLDKQGRITKAFGVQNCTAGFMVNGVISSTPINATEIGEGDTIDFFNYQDAVSKSDKVVWLEQNGQKKSEFVAAPGVPLTLKVNGSDYHRDVAAVTGVQLAVVEANGDITPVGEAADENGLVSVNFSQPGNYTITVISSGETKVIMPIAHVKVTADTAVFSIEARTAGQGDFLTATVVELDLSAPQTVKELLDAAAKQFGLDVVYTENGGLRSINGLSSADGGWRCYVNGEAAKEAIGDRKIAPGDSIRIRYAVTASAEELNAPLYQYLKSLVEDAKDKLTLAYTQDSKQILHAAVIAAEEILNNPANNSNDTDKELLVSKHIAAINTGVGQLVPEKAEQDPTIPEDFENDLWLQYDYKDMKVGERASIYPRRVPQIIDNAIDNTITRPVFRFEIVEGDSITLSEMATREKTWVTAVKEGVSVVKVTYDAEGEYGACSPINEGYVVFNVGNDDASLKITTSLSKIRSYDTIYYTGAESVAYPFTVSVSGVNATPDKVSVSCNGVPLTENDNGTYTAQLGNRSNVIGITATDTNGNVTTYYQVVDARKLQVVVENKTSPGQPLKINDTARISFRGLTMPVSKLATIYNPCFGEGNPRTYVYYQNKQFGEQRGYCNQYDLATKNSFELTFTEAGDYMFTGGRIHCAWWGDELGSDKNKEGKGDPNMGASAVEDNFSWLPDFTIHVMNEVGDTVPVTGIKLNRTELTLMEGERFSLTAKVLPEDATNKNLVWTCDDPTGFFIELDKASGKITAMNANTDAQPSVTVTATTEDGTKTASCKVTVKAVSHKVTVENGVADPSSAARKTVVTIKASQAPTGQQFDHWEVTEGTVNLKNSKMAETTFVMPDSDVTIKAIYAAIKVPDRKPGGDTHVIPSKPENESNNGKPSSNTIDAQVVNDVVSAKSFEDIKGKNMNLRIKGKLEDGTEFIWTINGNDITTITKLKVGMSNNGRFAEDIGKLAEQPEIFRFLEDGRFAAPMQVEMPTKLEDGSYLLMRYNDTERRAEKISKVEVKDGMFKFLAEEGGEYFLAKRVSGKSVPELETMPVAEVEKETGSMNVILVVALTIGVTGLAACAWFMYKKRKENKID